MAEDVGSMLSGLIGGDEGGIAPALDPYDVSVPENREKVSKILDDFLKVNESTRGGFEWGWFRNLCLIAGAHDIVKLQGQVKTRPMPKYYPRTQTNKFREKYHDLMSALVTGRVPIKHLPATDDPEAHATAEIGERVRAVIYAEADLDEKESEFAEWFLATGNVFGHPYYDYDEKYGTTKVPKRGCGQCGTVFGSAELPEAGEDTTQQMCPECDEQGMPPSPLGESGEIELLPIGALCVDVLSPFEVRGDLRIRDVSKWPWFVKIKRYDLSYAKEKLEYKGGEEDNPDEGQTLSQHYLDVIAALNDQFNPQSGFGNTNQGSQKVPKVTAYELYMMPNETYPEGLCVTRVGKSSENVSQIGPLDSEYGVGVRKGKKFLPLVHGKASPLPGRTMGSTPLDDAVPLQYFRNRVERALDMEIRRMANSMWLNPKGSGIDLFNGEAGAIYNYNPMTLGGTTIAKPERVAPQLQFLQYFIELLKQIDDQIERLVGTYFVGGGDSDPNVTAASALALLDQNKKKAMGPMVRAWAKMWLALDEMTLEIARKHWTDSRIRVAAGKNKAWEVDTFMNSDLQGGIRMEIDYQSLFPASEATERAEIEQLIQGGVISGQDPEQKFEILKKFGKLGMLGSTDVHTKVAQKENDAFLKSSGQTLPQIKPLVQNSMIHVREHILFCNTDEFNELPPEAQNGMLEHIQAHFVEEGEKRALMMQLQINPDSPGAVDITAAGAGAALSGAGQVARPNGSGKPGTATAGNQVGSRAPKGTTGNGPNQAKAADARGQQVMTEPPPDIAAAASQSLIPQG